MIPLENWPEAEFKIQRKKWISFSRFLSKNPSNSFHLIQKCATLFACQIQFHFVGQNLSF
jgi:hypothetical protein